MAIEIKRMWEGGPLRRWSDKSMANFQFYQSPVLKGYVGSYVCDECQEPVVGVYRQKMGYRWLCKACHVKVRPAKTSKTLDSRKVTR